MNDPIIIGPKFNHVIWLLLKAWVVGVLVAAILMGIIFTMGIDMSLETSTALKVIVTFIMGTLFLLLSATLFTLPLVVIAGILAYIFHEKIWRNPWITTCVTPIVGFVLFEVTTHLFTRATDTSLLETLRNGIFTPEGIAILIALTASAGYYSFKMRADVLAYHKDHVQQHSLAKVSK
jgi:hypothetical protein